MHDAEALQRALADNMQTYRAVREAINHEGLIANGRPNPLIMVECDLCDQAVRLYDAINGIASSDSGSLFSH